MTVLYLRTQFWFGLTAGGAVAHTAGVINSLLKKAEVQIVSNDHLPGTKTTPEIISPVIKRGLPSYICEIIYNFQIVSILRRRGTLLHSHGGQNDDYRLSASGRAGERSRIAYGAEVHISSHDRHVL